MLSSDFMARLASIALVSVASASFAGPYHSHGSSGGQTYLGGSIGGVEADVEPSIGYTDEQSTAAFQIYIGHDFNEFFGLEASFFTTGDVSDEPGIDGYFSGFSLTPKIQVPLSPSAYLYAKGGLASLHYEERYDDGDPFYDDDSLEWQGFVPTYGFGGIFEISHHAQLRVSYDYFDGTLEDDNQFPYTLYDDVDGTVSMAALGLQIKF